MFGIFLASPGEFPVTRGGGGRNVKFTCEGAKQCIFVMFPSPQPMFGIFQASPGDFPVTSGGGRNVKLICQGTKQCMFVMFPSPQPMFGIFLASPGDFPVTSGGGRTCKIYMRGCQTMHICDVSKPSANVWNILQDTPPLIFQPQALICRIPYIIEVIPWSTLKI